MSTTKIIIIAIVVLVAVHVFFFVAMRRLKEGPAETLGPSGPALLLREENPQQTNRVIEIKGMTQEQFQGYVRVYYNDFCVPKDQIKITDDMLTIQGENDLIFTLPPSIHYIEFCNWVNYMAYCDKKHRYDVTGWYPIGDVFLNWYPLSDGLDENKKQNFSQSSIMLTIPTWDEEYDNVYFVTEDGNCYKQEFSGRMFIKQQYNAGIRYREVPISTLI